MKSQLSFKKLYIFSALILISLTSLAYACGGGAMSSGGGSESPSSPEEQHSEK